MTADEFDRAMAVLIAGVGRAMPEETVIVWRECFEGGPVDQFRRGITAALRDWTFGGFPPIGFVADRCGVARASVTDDQQAVLAWDTVHRAMRTHGGYRSVDWGDSYIPAAIEAVAQSWTALCEVPSDELMRFIKPKFIEAWKAFKAAGVNRGTVSGGILARDAGRLGYEAPEPQRLSDPVPAVTGFLTEKTAALPSPDSPRRLTVAASLADRMTLPPEEEVVTVPSKPPKEREPLPSQEEWHGRLEAQKRALEVKYGLLQKDGE